jgi:hypothetical protein
VRIDLIYCAAAVVAATEKRKGTDVDLFGDCNYGDCKTLRGSALIYKLLGGENLAEWICTRRVTQRRRLSFQLHVLDALHLGGSAMSDQFSGLLPDSRPTQDIFYNQNDPLIREEVLDSRLRGSVPRVLRFFLWILRDKIDRTSD